MSSHQSLVNKQVFACLAGQQTETPVRHLRKGSLSYSWQPANIEFSRESDIFISPPYSQGFETMRSFPEEHTGLQNAIFPNSPI
jgi:hypothetical protein